MKPLIVFLVLCAIAVGISIAAVGQQGYVLLFIPPATEIKMLLSLAIPLLIGLFFLLYAIIHFLKFTTSLPKQVKRYRENRRKILAKEELLDAVVAMIEGRYDQALLLADKSADEDGAQAFNRLIAARSAHHLHQIEKRDEWFSEAAEKPELKNAVAISKAALMTDENFFEGVENEISQIDIKDRSRLAHRLLIKAYFAQQKWQAALDFLRDFGRRGDRDKNQVAEAKRIAQTHILADLGITKTQMDVMWHVTPDDERSDPVILAAFIRCALRVQDTIFIRRQIESFMERDFDGPLVRLYGSFLDPDADSVQEERLSRWLAEKPDNPDILYAVGLQNTMKSQWEKAEEYLQQSLKLKPCTQTELALADLYEKMSKLSDASDIYRRVALLSETQSC